MTAALVVRGTGSVHDVITDIQAIPVPFPPARGDASSGDGRGPKRFGTWRVQHTEYVLGCLGAQLIEVSKNRFVWTTGVHPLGVPYQFCEFLCDL